MSLLSKLILWLSLGIFFSCTSYITPSVSSYEGGKYEVSKLNIKSSSNQAYSNKKAKNLILLIGDGMGVGQISAGLYSNNKELYLEEFPVVGLHQNHSSDNLITDSAAAATSFACGVKTYNGAIGVDADTIAQKTILEECEENGMATGMVASSTIVHATPASFIAHVKQRKMYEDIAKAFIQTEIDYFVGGGKKYFDRRKDDQNLIELLKKNNYNVSTYFEKEFSALSIDNSKNFGYLTSDADPVPFSQGRNYLLPASQTAIEFLKTHDDKDDEKGFFLMIEGSQIDWGGHANNAEYIISEMLEFDNIIGEVLKFAEEDGETLVVVTADHETGGFAVNNGSTLDSLKTSFTSTYHTAELIPVFAYGPGASNFSGMYENTEIYFKMREALGFTNKD